MRDPHGIDDAWLRFMGSLPPSLRPTASSLPRELGLAPVADVPWTQVFEHEVTLAAPALVVARSSAGPERARSAVHAHALAVIEAFATDRIADGQVRATGALVSVVARLRAARDAALERVGAPRAAFADADQATREAIAMERRLLASRAPVSFDEYAVISLAKQAVGIPSTVALAAASGWSAERRGVAVRLLGAVWLGLQMQDDAFDWSDDERGGGSWAVSLARFELGAQAPADEAGAGALVAHAGVVHRLLEGARERFASAARDATELGAERLAAWAGARAARAEEWARGERRAPGYVTRARALAPWAVEVLA